MSNPLVSVLMTAYNRENYIEESICSVLASTYRNFELIIVDDCSKDRTVEIARSFAAKDPRIKLYVNEHNLGQFKNRNLAAEYATGGYLKYLDSDDLLYPTGLEVLVNMMEKFPEAGYGLCSLDQDDARMYPFMLTPGEAYTRHFVQKVSLFHKAPLSSILRKEAFFAVGGFHNPLAEGDYEMWLVLSRKYNVVLMPQGVGWYRVHDQQIDFQRRVDPVVDFRTFVLTLKYLGEDCPMDKASARSVEIEIQGLMIRYILRAFIKNSPAKAAQMYKLAGYTTGSFLKNMIRSRAKIY